MGVLFVLLVVSYGDGGSLSGMDAGDLQHSTWNRTFAAELQRVYFHWGRMAHWHQLLYVALQTGSNVGEYS